MDENSEKIWPYIFMTDEYTYSSENLLYGLYLKCQQHFLPRPAG